MIIDDASEITSKATPHSADLFLTGYSSNSVEVLWDNNHQEYRNTLRNLYERLYKICVSLGNSHLILYSKTWGADYLRSPSVTTMQKLVLATINHNDKKVYYNGTSDFVSQLIENKIGVRKNFLFCSLFYFLRKILSSIIKYFRNSTELSEAQFTNVVYTIPSAITYSRSRLSCRYWGSEFDDIINSSDTCIFLKGSKKNSKVERRMIHEFDILPYYLLPKFVYLCFCDFIARYRHILVLRSDRESWKKLSCGERLFREYCLSALISDIAEDTVTHILYRMIGNALGARVAEHGRLFLLSENQAWERSFQLGLSESGFQGTVINFYHGGIKHNECRYDLHRDLINWSQYKQENIFVGTAESIPCFDSQLDFRVANQKLARTCNELNETVDTEDCSSGILVFGDINRELTLQMLRAVFAHKDQLDSEFVGVRWHPSWSRADVLQLENELSQCGLGKLENTQSRKFKWSVSSCFSTASLDSKALGLRIGIFLNPEWLNTSPLRLSEIEKFILPDYVISNPCIRDWERLDTTKSGFFAAEVADSWLDIMKFEES